MNEEAEDSVDAMLESGLLAMGPRTMALAVAFGIILGIVAVWLE